jgi:small-conductance mechanosensitive channel
MTREGNHVQIPNATIYKETIVNFTANPNERFDFLAGIGYADSVGQAQSLALEVLRAHPAVLTEPESLVLVEALGASTVNLRIYFWVDISRHDGLKVRSSVIRQIKRAFDEGGISMPDEAREIVFPEGIPLERPADASEARDKAVPAAAPEDADDVHSAEGGLTSASEEIVRQARGARLPEAGQDLLNPSPSTDDADQRLSPR